MKNTITKTVLMGTLLATLAGCASGIPFQGMSAEQLFDHAMRAYNDEDWDEAQRAFERLLFSHPTFGQEVDARFYLADVFLNKEEYLSASAEYQRLMDRFPGHPRVSEASLGICRCYGELSPHPQRDQGYTLQAMNACENVVADFPGTEAEREAEAIWQRMNAKLGDSVFQKGEYYYRRKFYDSAIIYFEDVVEGFPGTPAAPRSLLFLHRSFLAIGWDDRAEEVKNQLLTNYPDSPEAREIVNGQ